MITQLAGSPALADTCSVVSGISGGFLDGIRTAAVAGLITAAFMILFDWLMQRWRLYVMGIRSDVPRLTLLPHRRRRPTFGAPRHA